MGVLTPDQRRMIDEAVVAANSSDLVIAVLGDSPNTCGEGTDRISLDCELITAPLGASLWLFSGLLTEAFFAVPGVQMQLLAALVALQKPMIVLLVHGRPVTFGPSNVRLDSVDVLLASWIGGEEHGERTHEAMLCGGLAAAHCENAFLSRPGNVVDHQWRLQPLRPARADLAAVGRIRWLSCRLEVRADGLVAGRLPRDGLA